MKTKKKSILILLCLLAVFGCKEEANISDSLEVTSGDIIVGSDNRRESEGSTLSNGDRNKTGVLYNTVLENGLPVEFNKCTGTVIATNLVITAAHCLHNNSNFHKNFTFAPGSIFDHHLPFGRFPVLKSYFPKSYNTSYSNTADDIAILELGENHLGQTVGSVVGTYAYWGNEDFQSATDTQTIGYPGDRGFTRQVFHKNCGAYRISNKVVETDCDTAGGQSGSAYTTYSQAHGFRYIFAIHGSGSTDGGYNKGAFITNSRQKIINLIKAGTFSEARSKNEFNEEWRKVDHTGNYSINFMFKNTCSRDVGVALRFQVLGTNEWDNVGIYEIKAGTTVEIARSTNRHFYYFSTFDNGRTFTNRKEHWQDTRFRRDKVPMEKATKPTWGDFVVSVRCN